MSPREISDLAAECGFELAGVAAACPHQDTARYAGWLERGMAARMSYLADYRAAIREDPRRLLASARSIICVGKFYNGPEPYSTSLDSAELGWISRYAWGDDYHDVLRVGLERLAARLGPYHEWKACVDTAPLLERSYARQAGLGWIGKNTCLINEPLGSWFFLGELLTSLELEPDAPPPDRCGTCTRCIDACPTHALTPYELDARLCISYFTIELRGEVPAVHRAGIGRHVFGCDICQDVCPWNRRAPVTEDVAFSARHFAPPLEKLAALSEDEFRSLFRGSPVKRTKYTGFLRNVAIAMGNAGDSKFRAPLEKLAASRDPVVSETANWALSQIHTR
ncbi:MAG TPA: tRNA epoxyqueuosine(34) reductase QueG [Bryobacteraceae bacterium]|nr:tRNA epoxyqueuosine(34) reductase QueG [Bryobacteraceae bacterium]